MTTSSFPITGENINHEKWAQLFRRHHQGVDQGMTLTLSSVSDVATVSTGRAAFFGFMLLVTDPHELVLPADSVQRVWTIGIMYDPANEGAADGPLTLIRASKPSLVVPTGGFFMPLWDITRQPSQTLNLATVVSYRNQRASTLFADDGVKNPPTDRMVGPAIVVRKFGIDVFDGTEWTRLASDTGVRTDGFALPTGSNEWVNAGSEWRVKDGVAQVVLAAKRTAGTTTSNSISGSIPDIQVIRFPSGAKPPTARYPIACYATLSGTSFQVGATVTTDTAGNAWLYLVSTAPAVSIRPNDTVYATATFLV